MSVIYNAAVKTARMDTTRTQFASGTLEIMDASNVVLATLTLSASAGSVTGGVWTLGFVASAVNAAAAGTAAKAQVKTSGGTAALTGLTVGASGTDVVLSNTNVAAGQQISITGATVTHA